MSFKTKFKNISKFYTGDTNFKEDLFIPILKETKYYYRATGYFSSSILLELVDGIEEIEKRHGKITNFKEDLFIPILKETKYYYRATGYFSSSILLELVDGIEEIEKRHGKIKLLMSNNLSNDDYEAIKHGYEVKEIIEKNMLKSINLVFDEFEEEKLNYLAHLIANGILEIKIALMNESNGVNLYHTKKGIFIDEEGNEISFNGSFNASSNALFNFDELTFYSSYDNNIYHEQIKESFIKDWNGESSKITVYDFPEAVKEKIFKYKKDKFLRPSELIKKYQKPRISKDIKLRDYQLEAIDSWQSNKYVGYFDMATGTGKTYTAISALVRLLKNRIPIIICCPQNIILNQWLSTLKKFNFNNVVTSSEDKKIEKLENLILDFKNKVIDEFVFLTTNATFQKEGILDVLFNGKYNGRYCLVIDEAHNAGATGFKKVLSKYEGKFIARLGLSATLERQGDDSGNNFLYSFFKNECIKLGIEDAIKIDALVNYEYYPIACYMDDDERKQYLELSLKIAKLLQSKNESIKKRAESLCFERARLVSTIKDKILVLKKLLIEKEYINKNNILVYCGAKTRIDDVIYSQLIEVTSLLGNDLKMKVNKITGEETNRDEIINQLTTKQLNAICAIKCLDEGVDIPSLETAFILASSTNYREFVQRRGRVLRKSNNKSRAIIYDFYVLPFEENSIPSNIDDLQSFKNLVKKELNRINEYSKYSLNFGESLKLESSLYENYNLAYEKEGNVDDDEY